MLYKLHSFIQRHKRPARLTRWCKGKTAGQINKKFGSKVGFSSRMDGQRQYIEIIIEQGTIGCNMDENAVCIASYFFPDSEHVTPDFPESITNELKERKYSTGKEQINPDIFPELDLSGFTWEDWANLRPAIVRGVCERGDISDLYALVNRYGYDNVRDTIQNDIKSFPDVGGLYLASALFNIPLDSIKASRCIPELSALDTIKQATHETVYKKPASNLKTAQTEYQLTKQ